MIKSLQDKKYCAFLAYLKTERESLGLSVRDVATLIDEPFQTVAKIEGGARRFTVHEYMQYCRALKIEPMVGLSLLD